MEKNRDCTGTLAVFAWGTGSVSGTEENLNETAGQGMMFTETISAEGEIRDYTTGNVTNATADTGWQENALLGSENWGLGFGKEGEQPTGTVTAEKLAEYNAYFCGDAEEKILYLTFDCGFENGNTEAILDALKKHNVKATFFVVGHYLESAPELVKRMVEEGHTVGNHTYHHPDMSQISDLASFQKELDDVAAKYQEVTGQEMEMYYRPPQGKYSTENLQMAEDLGYSTFFWSLAYVDWYQDKQPTHAEAFDKLTKRVHPGAIVLLHNTSKTNGEIMDEILTKWEEMGYSFGTLEELMEKAGAGTNASRDEGNLNRT